MRLRAHQESPAIQPDHAFRRPVRTRSRASDAYLDKSRRAARCLLGTQHGGGGAAIFSSELIAAAFPCVMSALAPAARQDNPRSLFAVSPPQRVRDFNLHVFQWPHARGLPFHDGSDVKSEHRSKNVASRADRHRKHNVLEFVHHLASRKPSQIAAIARAIRVPVRNFLKWGAIPQAPLSACFDRRPRGRLVVAAHRHS